MIALLCCSLSYSAPPQPAFSGRVHIDDGSQGVTLVVGPAPGDRYCALGGTRMVESGVHSVVRAFGPQGEAFGEAYTSMLASGPADWEEQLAAVRSVAHEAERGTQARAVQLVAVEGLQHTLGASSERRHQRFLRRANQRYGLDGDGGENSVGALLGRWVTEDAMHRADTVALDRHLARVAAVPAVAAASWELLICHEPLPVSRLDAAMQVYPLLAPDTQVELLNRLHDAGRDDEVVGRLPAAQEALEALCAVRAKDGVGCARSWRAFDTVAGPLVKSGAVVSDRWTLAAASELERCVSPDPRPCRELWGAKRDGSVFGWQARTQACPGVDHACVDAVLRAHVPVPFPIPLYLAYGGDLSAEPLLE